MSSAKPEAGGASAFNAGRIVQNEAPLRAMRAAIWFLLVLYCLPFVAAAYSLYVLPNAGGQNPHEGMLKWFISFTSGDNQSLSLLHRALLPLMGGFAPVAFRDPANSRSSTFLMLLLIVAIGACIGLSAWFSEPSVAGQIGELDIIKPFDSKQIVSFFNTSQQVLGMYLLVLFGLSVAQ